MDSAGARVVGGRVRLDLRARQGSQALACAGCALRSRGGTARCDPGLSYLLRGAAVAGRIGDQADHLQRHPDRCARNHRRVALPRYGDSLIFALRRHAHDARAGPAVMQQTPLIVDQGGSQQQRATTG